MGNTLYQVFQPRKLISRMKLSNSKRSLDRNCHTRKKSSAPQHHFISRKYLVDSGLLLDKIFDALRFLSVLYNHTTKLNPLISWMWSRVVSSKDLNLFPASLKIAQMLKDR